MKRLKSIALGVIVLTQAAKSQNNNHRYYLEGQVSPGIQHISLAGGLTGAFGFYISDDKSIDLRAGEIYNFSDKNITGVISVTYRYHLKNGFFVGGGFAHHHQVSAANFAANPAEATMGTDKEILHRSGLAAGIGYNFKPLAKKGFLSCVYPTTNIMTTYMLRDNGKNPLVTFNVGLRIGLKKQ